MSRGNALGFIESVGLASAIAAADAALKAANVELVGRENSRGLGYITIKIVGEVGAVQAAIRAAKATSEKVARVWSTNVIPRPGDGLGGVMVWNKETQGADDWFVSRAPETPKAPEAKAPEPKVPEAKAPEAKAPEPKAPEAKAPEAKAPETKAPEAPKAPEAKAPVNAETSLAAVPKQEIVPVPDEEKPKPAVRPTKKPTGNNRPEGRRKRTK